MTNVMKLTLTLLTLCFMASCKNAGFHSVVAPPLEKVSCETPQGQLKTIKLSLSMDRYLAQEPSDRPNQGPHQGPSPSPSQSPAQSEPSAKAQSGNKFRNAGTAEFQKIPLGAVLCSISYEVSGLEPNEMTALTLSDEVLFIYGPGCTSEDDPFQGEPSQSDLSPVPAPSALCAFTSDCEVKSGKVKAHSQNPSELMPFAKAISRTAGAEGALFWQGQIPPESKRIGAEIIINFVTK